MIQDVDLNNANRGVWLVKVPKYIADRWERAKDGTDVGQLRIQGPMMQKPFWLHLFDFRSLTLEKMG